MIEEVAATRELSRNSPGSRCGKYEQAVSWMATYFKVARTLEQVGDPREFSGNALGSSHGQASGFGECFHMASDKNDRAGGKPMGALFVNLGSSCGAIELAVSWNLLPRAIEQVADPRKLSAYTLGAPMASSSKRAMGLFLYGKWQTHGSSLRIPRGAPMVRSRKRSLGIFFSFGKC